MNTTQSMNDAGHTLTTIYFDASSSLTAASPQRWIIREGFTDAPAGFTAAWILLRNGAQAASLNAPRLPAWLARGLLDLGHNLDPLV